MCLRPSERLGFDGAFVFAVDDNGQFACGGVDDHAVYGNVFGHQGVAADDAYGVAHAFFYVVETGEPVVKPVFANLA